jgi:hypothetical protein
VYMRGLCNLGQRMVDEEEAQGLTCSRPGRALCSTDIYLRSVASFAFARSKALYDGFASHGNLPPRGL